MNTATVHQFPTPPTRRAPRVNSWRWNEDEDDAIDVLPQECQIIYLRVFRKHMDYATGVVGIKRTISYGQIKERLEYQPSIHSNEKPIEYSQGQIKRLIQKLVDAGLAERMHDTSKGVAKMVFRLPMACSDAEIARHEQDTESATRQNVDGTKDEDTNRDMSATRGARHPSGSPVTPNPLTTFGGGASEPPKKSSSKTLEYTQEFEAAWAAYPKRSGSNPKRDAFKAWRARLAEGVSPDEMIAGVQRYAAHIQIKGSSATEFVMQGKRFFGPAAEFENDWTTPAPSANGYGAQGGQYANRSATDAKRAEQDRIAARLANPNDDGWMDGLFEEGSAAGAGEQGVYPAGSDLSEDMADGVQYGPDADASQTGSGYIDGEVVNATNEPVCGYGRGADQGRGRGVAAERGEAGHVPEASAGGLWNA